MIPLTELELIAHIPRMQFPDKIKEPEEPKLIYSSYDKFPLFFTCDHNISSIPKVVEGQLMDPFSKSPINPKPKKNSETRQAQNLKGRKNYPHIDI